MSWRWDAWRWDAILWSRWDVLRSTICAIWLWRCRRTAWWFLVKAEILLSKNRLAEAGGQEEIVLETGCRHNDRENKASARRTKSSMVFSLKFFFSGDILPFGTVVLGATVVCISVESRNGLVEIGLPP